MQKTIFNRGYAWPAKSEGANGQQFVVTTPVYIPVYINWVEGICLRCTLQRMNYCHASAGWHDIPNHTIILHF